jgi:hypothetical protein
MLAPTGMPPNTHPIPHVSTKDTAQIPTVATGPTAMNAVPNIKVSTGSIKAHARKMGVGSCGSSAGALVHPQCRPAVGPTGGGGSATPENGEGIPVVSAPRSSAPPCDDSST